jgi:hypothetical protein
MKLKSFLCILLVVCICPVVALAAEKNKDSSKSALEQLKTVDKTSRDAAQDANAGRLGSAKDKAGKVFDTPAPAASTGTVKNADTFKVKAQPATVQIPTVKFQSVNVQIPTVKSQPVNVQDPKEISKRENEAQKIRDKETAKKYKLDDPKKAPPKP